MHWRKQYSNSQLECLKGLLQFPSFLFLPPTLQTLRVDSRQPSRSCALPGRIVVRRWWLIREEEPGYLVYLLLPLVGNRFIGGRSSRGARLFFCATTTSRGAQETCGPLVRHYPWRTRLTSAPRLIWDVGGRHVTRGACAL